jgi:hypothetical protein
VVWLVVPREERVLRVGAALYALAATAAFLLATPVGGNVTRLGTLLGGPLLACLVWGRRPRLLALLAIPLLYWQWQPPVRDVAVARSDPSVRAAYYAPLTRFLTSRGGPARVEIPPTRNHWESLFVAARFPLARGWERQLDVGYNRLFYEPRLDHSRYRAWLERLGVAYVALPDARLDYSAAAEARLIRGGAPYLRPVWGSAHWRVYRVTRPGRMVSGPARLLRLEPQAFTLRMSRGASVVVAVRHSPYWKLAAGTGCVERAPGGFTRVRTPAAGEVRVVIGFAPGRVLDAGARCRRGR